MVRVTVVMVEYTLAPLTAMSSSVLISTHSTSESCPYTVSPEGAHSPPVGGGTIQ